MDSTVLEQIAEHTTKEIPGLISSVSPLENFPGLSQLTLTHKKSGAEVAITTDAFKAEDNTVSLFLFLNHLGETVFIRQGIKGETENDEQVRETVSAFLPDEFDEGEAKLREQLVKDVKVALGL